jgi:hypothetical protein
VGVEGDAVHNRLTHLGVFGRMAQDIHSNVGTGSPTFTKWSQINFLRRGATFPCRSGAHRSAYKHTIEFALDGDWVDITTDVYLRDRIKITRGRQDEGARVDPGSCTFTLSNEGGRFCKGDPPFGYPRSPQPTLHNANGTARVSPIEPRGSSSGR